MQFRNAGERVGVGPSDPRDSRFVGRALVLSAEADARRRLGELLARRGYRVESDDGSKIARHDPSEDPAQLRAVDLLVLRADAGELPKTFELLRRIERIAGAPPVVIVSPSASSRVIVDAMKLGAVDFLVEPIDAELLDLTLSVAALRGGRARAALVASPDKLAAEPSHPPPVLWKGAEMGELRRSLESMGATDVTILIHGESGVGKEVVARHAHTCSSRSRHPFVKVNCAALPETLLESELFGYERGAFTGADTRKRGKFELANRGTLFLDEIAEMSPALQAKLLQVLQDREYTRIGGNREVRVDIRVICATHWDLSTLVARGRFRDDLYYRLNVVKLAIPPLRERREIVGELARSFLAHYAARYGRPRTQLSPAMLRALDRYDFPGNIRELENLMKRLAVLGREEAILAALERHPDPEQASTTSPDSELIPTATSLLEVGRRAAQQAEQRAIDGALEHTGGNLKRAARLLGVSYKTLLGKTRDRRKRERRARP